MKTKDQELQDVYSHRNALIVAWLRALYAMEEELKSSGESELWRTKKSYEGEDQGDWFIVGYDKDGKKGYITYHLPIEFWDHCDFCTEIERSRWNLNKHTSEDVLERLMEK